MAAALAAGLPPESGDAAAELEAIAADRSRPPVERVAACMARALGLDRAPATDADFFTDLGGDSLRAVELLLWLRKLVGAELSVRDLYAKRTAEGLAGTLAAGRASTVRIERAAIRDRLSPVVAATAQAALLAAGFTLTGAAAFAGLFLVVPWASARLDPVAFAVLVPVAAFVVAGLRLPFGLAATLAVKAIFLGRYRPGRVEAWSGRYLGEWLVGQVAATIPWALIEGTELHAWTLRRLGARVGRRVHIHRGVNLARGGWDLLEIGDDAILGRDAALLTARTHRGGIEHGPVRIGNRAVIGIRATLEPGCTVGDGAEVEPLALVRGGVAVPAGERWGGVPAARLGTPADSPPAPRSAWGPWSHTLLAVVGRLGFALAAGLVAFAVAVALARFELGALRGWLDRPTMSLELAAFLVAAGLLSVPAWLVLSALGLRWLGPVRPGTYPRYGPAAWRIAQRIATLDAAGRWLSGTLLWPMWLRLAGMRIGKGSEVSTIIDTLPETLSIGAGSFFADGIYLAGPELRPSGITVRETGLGDETFLGNHCVVPAGVRYPAGMFIGVSTVAPAGT
ncbi:MAG: phosphopantetheine-binding protein, partial [Planctomycetaceae bacterium]